MRVTLVRLCYVQIQMVSALTIGDVGRVIEQGIDRNRAYFVGEKQAISIRIDRSAPRGCYRHSRSLLRMLHRQWKKFCRRRFRSNLYGLALRAIFGPTVNVNEKTASKGLGWFLLLLFLFLKCAKPLFWVAAGIPAAMAAAVALMFVFGITNQYDIVIRSHYNTWNCGR